MLSGSSLCGGVGLTAFSCSGKIVSPGFHGNFVLPPSTFPSSSSPSYALPPLHAPPCSISCAFPSSSLLLSYPSDLLDAHLPSFSHGKLLSELSTLGIGGPAKFFCEVNDDLQLASALRYCHQQGISFLVIGKGSNCLFDDLGFDGCIILNRIWFLQNVGNGVYRVGSGYPYNVLGMQCSRDGFTGLEFASGIPGTVGGAVFMNAGANGQVTLDASAVFIEKLADFSACSIL